MSRFSANDVFSLKSVPFEQKEKFEFLFHKASILEEVLKQKVPKIIFSESFDQKFLFIYIYFRLNTNISHLGPIPP